MLPALLLLLRPALPYLAAGLLIVGGLAWIYMAGIRHAEHRAEAARAAARIETLEREKAGADAAAAARRAGAAERLRDGQF